MMLPYTPQSKGELLRVQARVFLFAPDSWSQPSNTLPGEEIALDSSFGELHRGVEHVYRNPRHDLVRRRMHDLLDQSYAEFKAGNIGDGRKWCLEFENLVNNSKP